MNGAGAGARPNKKLKLSHRAAQRDMSVEILSAAPQLYEKKSHLKRLATGE